ncbi:enoyl-CoA hydratase [Lentibacillus cibarius]|uniref:Enoyl-CoA hydratase n=1 Tax=Lentibacillus cibarius TaxID=2583219 RepID=A0A5S3QGT1_9BACI|nr:enoyl-CoA hydratase [Lentibacillus cibarius]TMN21114.1 enoyl-CoA hydratase [Lentibacillus cibarius]
MAVINYEVEKQIAVLTIQSPPANALSSNLLNGLEETLDKIENDTNIKTIVIKGDGKFFSAGADIKEFTSLQNASEYRSLSEKGQQIFDRMEHFPIPIIAAIHGAALGGGLELALACHIRIGSDSAKLGLPETTLGIIPGFAGTQRLPRFVGSAKAYEMILSGEPISGNEAKAFGLLNRVTKEEDVFDTAYELAETIAAKSKLSITSVMELIPYAKTEQFQKGIQQESEAFAKIFGSEDAKEGVQAFIDKRKPNFKDK